MQTYIVQTGDTLYGISKQFGVSIADIVAENNLSTFVLRVGQVLKIPSIETTTLYIVKEGDTIYSISRKFNVSVDDIIRINNLNSNLIAAGRELFIPVPGDGGYLLYEVVSGDTLYSISRKYDVDIQTIREINSLSNNNLSIGYSSCRFHWQSDCPPAFPEGRRLHPRLPVFPDGLRSAAAFH